MDSLRRVDSCRVVSEVKALTLVYRPSEPACEICEVNFAQAFPVFGLQKLKQVLILYRLFWAEVGQKVLNSHVAIKVFVKGQECFSHSLIVLSDLSLYFKVKLMDAIDQNACLTLFVL